MQWTKDQQEVIDSRKKNILVSAAAGAGKTAVLVERIISIVTDENEPVDIDRLLVVTFTNAAASEMRERILAAIEEKSKKNPGNVHLQRQQSYIHNADITTIDSFCMKVVKEYFNKLDMDPGFRIGEEGELKLLMSDVMDEMLEEHYEKGPEEFYTFVDEYSTAKTDREIADNILNLYRFTSSRPEPEMWLNECREYYNITSAEELENSKYMNYIKKFADEMLEQLYTDIESALNLCGSEDGPKGYADSIQRDKIFIEQLMAGSFDERTRIINSYEFGPIGRISKKDMVDEKYKLAVAQIRSNIKQSIKFLSEDIYYTGLEDMTADISGAAESVNILIDLTIEFIDRYKAAKAEKNIVDFSDVEHYAYKILTKKDEHGNVVQSDIACELSKKYTEIIIDEYQDSNYLQEYILNSIAKGQGVENVFMVGDVKQSIYGFRHAEPALFIQKYTTYDTDGNALFWKKNLGKNFRSRSEIINSVNCIFGRIMNGKLGGVNYDDDSGLYIGAQYPEAPQGQNQNTEIICVEKTETGKEKVKAEALAVANRISELMNPDDRFQVYDKKSDRYRDIKYRDIVVLARDVKNVSDVFSEVFTAMGIPSYIESRSGYLDSVEIKTVLNLLTIINNPIDDIPLAAVLKSPIYGFTSMEFAMIRSANVCRSFYDSIVMYSENGEDEKLKEKIKRFLNKLNEYRKIAPYTAIYDLIAKLYEDTDYYNYVAAMPSGGQRCKNLDILYDKAVSYDDGSYKGLFKFVKYIENLKKVDIDYGEASALGENDDIVRIMTIHKSKGLQFPVVIVAGLGNNFMIKDLSAPVLLHSEFGIGADNIDSTLRVKSPTILKNIIKYAKKSDKYAEEMRVLYVALTRAEEKLILFASQNKVEEKLGAYRLNAKSEKIPVNSLLSASSFIDWILESVYGEDNPHSNIEIKTVSSSIDRLMDPGQTARLENMLEKSDCKDRADNEIADKIKSRITFKYPYESDTIMQSKTSVTALKIKAMEYDAQTDGAVLVQSPVSDIIPEFIEKKRKLTGADRGTAYHRVFEIFDFEIQPTEQNLKEMMKKFLSEGKIDNAIYNTVRISDLTVFAGSDLGTRMRRAYKSGKLFRERPYVMGIPADSIDGGCSDGELVLVQGVIDVCFEENGKMVVADYKTDRVSDLKQLADKYSVQLGYYERAITQITGTEVKEKIIYSVELGGGISL